MEQSTIKHEYSADFWVALPPLRGDTGGAKDREEAKESPSSNSNQPISGVTTVNIAELLAEQAAQEQQTQSEAKPPENVQFFGRWFLRDLSDIYSEIMN